MMPTISEIVFNTIIIVLFLFSSYATAVNLYYFVLSLRGFGKEKRDYDIHPDSSKFLILIAAHNEENVIASTYLDLLNIDYDKNLFDIYVINDNSTDKTEQECQKVNAPCINTTEQLFPREAVGKPGAIQYALRYLGFDALIDRYDLILILDADNHTDYNILKELNSQWLSKEKPEAIQVYLDSKNSDTVLSKGYAAAYVNTNRFFQLAKYRLKLPNALGGTGFVVTSKYLITSGGFKFKSLTEDLEMSIEIIKNNGRVLWNHFTRIYDEKPDNLKISIRQRTRWMQGHWYVAIHNFLPLIKRLFVERKLKYMDQLIYLFGMGASLRYIFVLISCFVCMILALFTNTWAEVSNNIGNILSGFYMISALGFISMFYNFIIMQPYASSMDKIGFFTPKVYISIIYYSYTFLYCQIVGFIKHNKQNVWVKTEHKYTIAQKAEVNGRGNMKAMDFKEIIEKPTGND